MGFYRVIVQSNEVRIAERIEIADTFFSRLRGLLGRYQLLEGEGMLITKCRSVHTFFMNFPIDIIFLDKFDQIKKISLSVKPFRCVFGTLSSVKVLELSIGSSNRCRVGDVLKFQHEVE